MNLNYRILWVDDHEGFIESLEGTVDAIKNYIADQGFDPFIEFRVSPEAIEKDVDGNNFDLMVIDYNLTEDGSKKGDDVIRSVRSSNCLTEVIFYSGDADNVLRVAAAEKKLDGIFFSSKETDSLMRKVLDVFDLTIRKVVDTNNMRGVVMAGVAGLDHQLHDLISKVHDGFNEEQKIAHRKKLLEKMLPAAKAIKQLIADETHISISNLQKLIDTFKDFEPKDFTSLVTSRGFDSYKRVEIATSLCKGHARLAREKEKIEEIKKLLLWRNALAHQKPIEQDGIQIFDLDGTATPFDDSCRTQLRKILRQHRQHLEEILENAGNQ